MPITLDEFIESVTTSGLMDAGEIQSFITMLPMEQQPRTAEDLAKELYRQGKLTKFQAQAIYQKKTRGLVVGNYVVLDKLGKGGMGAVYKAQHKRMKRIVALKMLPSSATKSSDSVRRFQQEVEAAARLTHPNIVTAHDADEAKGVHFLVMEYVEGQDLHAMVKEHGTLSVARAVDYTIQAAKGLEYAHSQGVIHRDIKPHNLLLDKAGAVKILDMGLARIGEAAGDAVDDEGLTRSGQVMGTLDYMSPEQALDTKTADARADIYSLGCTLHYLLLGRSPYGGNTVGKKMLAHRMEPIPSLRKLRNDVPQQLDSVFQKMLAKEPKDRQQTMTEVISELQACVLPQGSLPVPPSFPPSSGSYAETVDLQREETAPPIPLSSPLDELFAGESVQISERLIAPSRRYRKHWTKQQTILVAAVAGGIAFVLLLLGVILKMKTSEGTLVVELDQPDATVQVLNEQGKVLIERQGQKGSLTIGVDPGKRRLRVEKDGFEVFAKEFAIASGGKETIKAKLEPKPDIASVQPVQSSPATPAAESLPAAPDKRSKQGPSDDEGFVSLFDGKTLHGWSPQGNSHWTVDDGALHGTGGRGTLRSDGQFSDFILRAEIKINAAGNSGVILCSRPGLSKADYLEVQVIGSEKLKSGGYDITGSLSGRLKASKDLVRDDEWFTMEFLASGNHIVVKIQDQVVMDYQETGPRPARGFLELQVWSVETHVWFRNIRVKELPSTGTEQPSSTGAPAKPLSTSPDHPATPSQGVEEGFVSLFDGKTLNGWQGATDRYTVQDGKIVVDFGPQPFHGDGQLVTAREYRDFVLRLEYTMSPAANNGVLLRAPPTARTSKDAIEVQILDDSADTFKNLSPSMRNGSLSRIVAAKPGPVKPFGEWNSLEVQWEGRHVRVTLNGAVTVDTNLGNPTDKDPEGASHPGLKRNKGHIVLHSYGSQGKVEFRNIRIKELSPASDEGKSQAGEPDHEEKTPNAARTVDSKRRAVELRANDWIGLPQCWRVTRQGIMGSTGPAGITFNTFLCTKKTYRNFELTCQVRLIVGNTGVQFRSDYVDHGKFMLRGPQVDMGLGYWGSLFGEKMGTTLKAAPPRTRQSHRQAGRLQRCVSSLRREACDDQDQQRDDRRRRLPLHSRRGGHWVAVGQSQNRGGVPQCSCEGTW